MGDALILLQLIQRLASQIRNASELVKRMREEGRDTLTDEEKATLRANDDEARQELVDAIASSE
jgi:hypothetical protein